MKPPKFHVGQAVVFVDPSGRAERSHENLPCKGKIYHVRALREYTDTWGLLLEEIVNRPRFYLNGFNEVCFDERRFAPVEELPDEALAELLEETLAPVTA